MFKDFKKFLLRGNLVDLAIGFTVGAAFSTLVKSLVNDILMPPVSILLGTSDFSGLFIVLRNGIYDSGPYGTLAEAEGAGAVVVRFGSFINNLLSLFIIGLAMFVVIKIINRLNEQMEVSAGKKKDSDKTPSDKKCPYCFTTIPYRATRCLACTSQLKTSKLKK